MKSRRIFILLGHPDNDSLNFTLADQYQRGAESAGHEVRRMNISEMKFDPILHNGYRLIQELEPDLVSFQENMRWCDHFVVFYPSWWSTMPAILKGLFDRVWLPGFAFKFTGDFTWQKLLKGKKFWLRALDLNQRPSARARRSQGSKEDVSPTGSSAQQTKRPNAWVRPLNQGWLGGPATIRIV